MPESPAPGSLIDGKYRVVRPIGAGGMGIVVEAVHLALGHRVAVKLVHGIGDSRRAMARFLHEARVAAQLPGDHICRAIDVGRAACGLPFLVMELLAGRDLQAELDARRCIPVSEAVDLLLQACEGTAEAHAVGLVHRDLKPANLFLAQRRDGSRLVKVLDFGISRWALGSNGDASTLNCGTAGTPAYMAPEQFEIDVKMDARCDQHALAVVLYEMLTGAPPFIAPTAYALALLIAREEARPLREIMPEIPPGLEAVILKALAKSPDERFPDLAAFAQALAPFGSESARASARNITAILAAASALGVVTVRSSVPPARSRRPHAPDSTLPGLRASAFENTLLGPRPTGGRKGDGLSGALDRRQAAQRIQPRLLSMGSLAIALAAIGLTGALLNAGDPPEENRTSMVAPVTVKRAALFPASVDPAALLGGKVRVAKGCGDESALREALEEALAPAPLDLAEVADDAQSAARPPSRSTLSRHPTRLPLPQVEPAPKVEPSSRPRTPPNAAPPSVPDDRTAREVFGARR